MNILETAILEIQQLTQRLKQARDQIRADAHGAAPDLERVAEAQRRLADLNDAISGLGDVLHHCLVVRK